MPLCECGCGQEVSLAKKTSARSGHVKGQPLRYVYGHSPIARPWLGQYGENHIRFKGGKVSGGAGYIQILLSLDDPFICMAAIRDESYYVYEHRIVMARHINRPLWSEEVVHHINGDRADNRIENLQLFHTQGAHSKYHAKLRRDNASSTNVG